jgi:hypothetical protein
VRRQHLIETNAPQADKSCLGRVASYFYSAQLLRCCQSSRPGRRASPGPVPQDPTLSRSWLLPSRQASTWPLGPTHQRLIPTLVCQPPRDTKPPGSSPGALLPLRFAAPTAIRFQLRPCVAPTTASFVWA